MPSSLATALLYLASGLSFGTALGHTKMGYDLVFPALQRLGGRDKGAISARIGWLEVNQGFIILGKSSPCVSLAPSHPLPSFPQTSDVHAAVTWPRHADGPRCCSNLCLQVGPARDRGFLRQVVCRLLLRVAVLLRLSLSAGGHAGACASSLGHPGAGGPEPVGVVVPSRSLSCAVQYLYDRMLASHTPLAMCMLCGCADALLFALVRVRSSLPHLDYAVCVRATVSECPRCLRVASAHRLWLGLRSISSASGPNAC